MKVRLVLSFELTYFEINIYIIIKTIEQHSDPNIFIISFDGLLPPKLGLGLAEWNADCNGTLRIHHNTLRNLPSAQNNGLEWQHHPIKITIQWTEWIKSHTALKNHKKNKIKSLYPWFWFSEALLQIHEPMRRWASVQYYSLSMARLIASWILSSQVV